MIGPYLKARHRTSAPLNASLKPEIGLVGHPSLASWLSGDGLNAVAQQSDPGGRGLTQHTPGFPSAIISESKTYCSKTSTIMADAQAGPPMWAGLSG